MKKSLQSFFALLIGMSILAVSCELELKKPEVDEVVAEDGAQTSKVVYDIMNSINSQLIQGVASNKQASDCPLIEENVVGNETKIKITYPEAGCDQESPKKTGIINISHPNNFEIGNSATATFENFTIDENEINGTITILFKQLFPLTFELTMSEMKLTYPNEEFVAWEAVKTFTMLDGFLTPFDLSDDKWKINGTTSGTASNNKTFSSVETDLLTSPNCKWFVGGEIEITLNGDTFTIVFNQDCGSVTYTYKGVNHNATFD